MLIPAQESGNSVARVYLERELNMSLGVDGHTPFNKKSTADYIGYTDLEKKQKEKYNLVSKVIEIMSVYPWVELTGLNFKQTMELSFHEWTSWLEFLSKEINVSENNNMWIINKERELNTKLERMIQILEVAFVQTEEEQKDPSTIYFNNNPNIRQT